MFEALQDLSDSFAGTFVGFLLFFLAIALTWFVEKSAVRFAMLLKRAETATRTIVDPSRIDSRFDKRCVLVKGMSRASDSNACYDPDTGYSVEVSGSAKALRLRRTVAMYQWVSNTKFNHAMCNSKAAAVTQMSKKLSNTTPVHTSSAFQSAFERPEKAELRRFPALFIRISHVP
jgi:hypothetical protein